MGRYDRTTYERFCAGFAVQSTGCWDWIGSKRGGGYGAVRLFGRSESAHRLSWLLFCGLLPVGFDVCHSCDNRICVNPAHLFLGTRAENIADMMAKGRQRGAVGARNAKAKLTPKKVFAIRAAFERGVSQSLLAHKFGVHQTQISNVLLKKSWAHV